ncbi:MAG: hypothetical protein HY779_05850, partial [Rubrobacteridae bacterium]|nr:hypothetical protein [Rubrobacteridae bacterium]
GGFSVAPGASAQAPASRTQQTSKDPVDPKDVVWEKQSKAKPGEGSDKGRMAAESSAVMTEVRHEDEVVKKAPIEPVYVGAGDSDAVDFGVKAGSDNVTVNNAGETEVYSIVDVETVNKHWPQVMKLIKDKKRARYHFFAAAKVKRVEDGKLVLAMKSAERQFIENPENLQLLRNALKIASGIDMPIICETDRENVKTVAVTDVAKTSTAEDDFNDEVLAIGDYIKMVQDTFGAKIVEDITLEE